MTGADLIAQADIEDVRAALEGAPLRGNRGRAFWRGGDGLNVSYDMGKKTFYDHVRGEGGGILDLIQLATGRDRQGALQWLANLGGVELDGVPKTSSAERRRWVQQQAQRQAELSRAQNWRRGRIAALRLELRELQGAHREALFDAWQAARRADEANADACESWGAEDAAQAMALTGVAIAIIAEAEHRALDNRPPQEGASEAA